MIFGGELSDSRARVSVPHSRPATNSSVARSLSGRAGPAPDQAASGARRGSVPAWPQVPIQRAMTSQGLSNMESFM